MPITHQHEGWVTHSHTIRQYLAHEVVSGEVVFSCTFASGKDVARNEPLPPRLARAVRMAIENYQRRAGTGGREPTGAKARMRIPKSARRA